MMKKRLTNYKFYLYDNSTLTQADRVRDSDSTPSVPAMYDTRGSVVLDFSTTEPGSVVLSCASLIALACFRRRKQASNPSRILNASKP